MEGKRKRFLEETARRIAERVIRIAGYSECHVGGSLSAADLLAVLYFEVLRVDPERPARPDRDYFILSKGHALPALAAALSLRGFFPENLLEMHLREGGIPGHPKKGILPGVEASTGSLGHGLPLAVGLALALRAERAPNRVFVLLGDGELQEGSNWEGAMCAAHYGLERLVAVVDRNMFQTGPTEEILSLEPLAAKWESFGWGVRRVPGHDVGALASAFAELPFAEGKPSVLIAETKKGYRVPSLEGVHAARLDGERLGEALKELGARGEGPAGPAGPREDGWEEPEVFLASGAGETEPLPDRPLSFPDLLLDLARKDDRIFAVGCDTWNFFLPVYRAFPERVVEVGIAEQTLAGVAAGLALRGKVPFAVGLNPFLTMRAFEQIRTDIAYGEADVKLVGGHGSGVRCAAWGPTHHAVEEIALMRVIPGMTVLMPSDARETEAAVRVAARWKGPFYISLAQDVPGPPGKRIFRLGRASLRRPGRDAALLSTGAILEEVLEAAERLEEEGISARVLAFPTVKPLDREAVLSAAEETGALVTVEEHSLLGGLGSAVAEVLAEAGGAVPLLRLGLPDRFLDLGGERRDFLARLGLDASGIARRVLAWGRA